MYTFNLSTLDKNSKLKQKQKGKDGKKGVDTMRDKVDGMAVKNAEVE